MVLVLVFLRESLRCLWQLLVLMKPWHMVRNIFSGAQLIFSSSEKRARASPGPVGQEVWLQPPLFPGGREQWSRATTSVAWPGAEVQTWSQALSPETVVQMSAGTVTSGPSHKVELQRCGRPGREASKPLPLASLCMGMAERETIGSPGRMSSLSSAPPFRPQSWPSRLEPHPLIHLPMDRWKPNTEGLENRASLPAGHCPACDARLQDTPPTRYPAVLFV